MNPTATRPDLPASPDAAHGSGDAALAALLQASAGGDGRAFEAFYDRTVARAELVARALLRAADVDEALADAYFEAWRQAARFDPTRGSALSWLLALVRSGAVERLRPAAVRRDDIATEPGADAAELIDGWWQQLNNPRLHTALAALDAGERWALGLAYLRGCTQLEIASRTGWTPDRVHSVLAGAQAKLRLAANGSALLP